MSQSLKFDDIHSKDKTFIKPMNTFKCITEYTMMNVAYDLMSTPDNVIESYLANVSNPQRSKETPSVLSPSPTKEKQS